MRKSCLYTVTRARLLWIGLATSLVGSCLQLNDEPPIATTPDVASAPVIDAAAPLIESAPPPPPPATDVRADAADAAAPSAPACMASAKRCGAAGLETCRSDGSGWDVVACPAGCALSGVACATCKAGADRCTPGGPQEVCNEDGSAWVARACPTSVNGAVTCDPDGGCGLTCNVGYLRCGGKPATCARARWTFATDTEGFTATGIGVTGMLASDVLGTRALAINLRLDADSRTLVHVENRPCSAGMMVSGRRATAKVLLRGGPPAEFDRPTLTVSADLGGGSRVEATMIYVDVDGWQTVTLEAPQGALWHDLRFTLQLVSSFEQPWSGSLNIADVRIE